MLQGKKTKTPDGTEEGEIFDAFLCPMPAQIARTGRIRLRGTGGLVAGHAPNRCPPHHAAIVMALDEV
ncbi:hypothetical protein E4L95_09250 [Paracoccus liaowanqingii]|uniref:Uncharacterized protein n=1 Tax=Paracoccus liaowanqingii TaxID=2560053 RepID=A0A4Z1C9U1_9RHOB|nr:hypothetical protein [Paracoccus liaowanqingii]TGN61741.1 hypothetical protein E4L95_09250 [Paracoccus liaowanqingii]